MWYNVVVNIRRHTDFFGYGRREEERRKGWCHRRISSLLPPPTTQVPNTIRGSNNRDLSFLLLLFLPAWPSIERQRKGGGDMAKKYDKPWWKKGERGGQIGNQPQKKKWRVGGKVGSFRTMAGDLIEMDHQPCRKVCQLGKKKMTAESFAKKNKSKSPTSQMCNSALSPLNERNESLSPVLVLCP